MTKCFQSSCHFYPYLPQGGAALDLNSVQAKPFGWMLDMNWLNIVELSKHELFSQLLEKVRRSWGLNFRVCVDVSVSE